MADVPKNLLEQIERLEGLFTVPKEKLHEITEHFVNELEKGKTMLGNRSISERERES